MIKGDQRRFAELFIGGRQAGDVVVFEKVCFKENIRVLQDPEAVYTICEDYKASASLDIKEAKEDIEERRLIKDLVRVLWGKHGIALIDIIPALQFAKIYIHR